MLPKFLTHLDKKTHHHHYYHRQQQREATTTSRRWLCPFPLVLLASILFLCSGSCSAEKDFNFNDSQVPLLEPKDEPILIDQHADSSADSSSIESSGGSLHHYAHNDKQDPYSVEWSQCPKHDNRIVLSFVLKHHNWVDFDDSRKDKVLTKLSNFFAIQKKYISMESVAKRELCEMENKSLQKGNNKCHNYNNNTNRKLGRVDFTIGCGSALFTVCEPISKQISRQVRDGAIDNITGEKFGWWFIWSKPNKPQSVRNRRQIEGSGDDDDDDDYYEYDDDSEDLDSTTTAHAHRHHHGDDTSDVNSKILEAAINKNVNRVENNELENMDSNNIHGDITALKQIDTSASEAGEEQVEKSDSDVVLLNKKADNIDEEIVKSVSQLESVITKTIENTKNLDDVPDIVVNQSDDELLSEVMQPLSPLEDIQSPAKADDTAENLNAAYENRHEMNTDDALSGRNEHNEEFNVAEVHDSLISPTTTTSASNSLTTINTNANNLAVAVNVEENLESFSDSTTTPLSFTSSNSNKNNYTDSSFSLESANHAHSHHKSQSLEPLHKITEITTAIITTNPSSHFTPAILSDSTTITTTITTSVNNTPFDSSSTFATTSASPTPTTTPSPSPPPTPPPSPPQFSSSSSSYSTLLSTVSKKNELSSNSTHLDYTHNMVDVHTHNNNNYNDDDDDDDDDDDNDDVEGDAGLDEEQTQDVINANMNAELLNTFTTIRTLATAKSQSTTSMTTEHQQQQQEQKKEQTQQQHHRHQYYPGFYDNSREIYRTKATTSNYAAPSLPPTLDMTPVITMMPTLSSATAPSSLLTPPPTLDLPIENVFEIDIYGKKDETTVQPTDNKGLPGMASTAEDSSASVTTPSVKATTNTATPTPVVISSSTGIPDYVEPKIENTPPMIKSRLQKLAVTSGKSFRLPVPEDTFYDNEDLTNLRLELTDKEGQELKSNSWLQFNAETREIYGLPLDDAVSKWLYRLTATDSGNESVTEILEISVQQHRGVRTVNHEINISVKVNERNMHYIDWQMSLINAIAATLGDANINSIAVREIRGSSQDLSTATLVYFNETLPTSECPERELNNLVKRLDVSRLSDLVQPILGIKSLTGQLIGSCQKTAAAKPKTPTLNIKNAPPVPRNQVDRVVATVGHLLVYKVPSDTFFDPNDQELALSLKTKDHKELTPRHWLQFDSKNEEFYGIPKSGDIGSEEYMLVAEDAGGLTATDALVVQVNHAPKRDFSVYIKIYLAIRHEQFNADLQRKFVERIAKLFGDVSTQNIQIRSVTTHHDSDGTIVNFYNTTLFKSHNRCPEEEMEALRSVYLHEYTVRERVKKALGPELNITNVQVIPLGTCNAPTDNTHREFVPNKTDEPLLKSTFSDDYMYTIILPAIIILFMVIIASIIACCLHRRRRKSGKMELGDEEERKSFRTKGIPVIFQDELDEKPEIGNKSPIILKDEKPPLLPPSYNTSNMNGDNDVDEYVPPPAVVVGGREARGKSPATPSYRKPPPYVSP